jgi:hypothetical protein
MRSLNLFVSMILLWTPAFGWELQKNSQNIMIYTRTVEGSAIKEFKGTTKIKSNLSAFLGLLSDSKACPKWIHQCKFSKVLKVISQNERLNYNITDLPFPVTDRDIVIHSKVSQDPKTKTVTVRLINKRNYKKPVSGLVRVEKLSGYWKFKPLGNGYVQVTYQVHSEPGGSLPNWLINSGAVDMPFETLKNLKRIIPSYQNSKFDLIKE